MYNMIYTNLPDKQVSFSQPLQQYSLCSVYIQRIAFTVTFFKGRQQKINTFLKQIIMLTPKIHSFHPFQHKPLTLCS